MAMAWPHEYDAEQPVIDAIRGGDRYAFEELVRRHDRWVRGVIFGIVGHRDRVDDVAQQVWAAVWERIGELRDPTRWRPWLYRLARNAAIDVGRDVTRQRRRSQKLALHPGVNAEAASRINGQTPDGEIISAEERREVLAAIEALPRLYREPFVLRHLNGWSYREIADVMDMPVDSVETRLVRARRFLCESLKHKLA